MLWYFSCFFFSSRRRHTRYWRDRSSDVCSSDLGAMSEVAGRDYDRGRDDRDQNTWKTRFALQQKYQNEGAGSYRECRNVYAPFEDLVDDSPDLAQRSLCSDREAEELWNLAQQYCQCDAVHIAIADGL